jgi:putative transposase
MTWQRQEFHWKLAYKLLNKYDILVFETLDMNWMRKKHGRKVNDLGFSKFLYILEYLASRMIGKKIIYVDKYFPSTKLCHNCGYKNDNLHIWDRVWTCPRCGTSHDRDLNAALNIFNAGIYKLGSEPRSELKDGTSSFGIMPYKAKARKSLGMGNMTRIPLL